MHITGCIKTSASFKYAWTHSLLALYKKSQLFARPADIFTLPAAMIILTDIFTLPAQQTGRDLFVRVECVMGRCCQSQYSRGWRKENLEKKLSEMSPILLPGSNWAVTQSVYNMQIVPRRCELGPEVFF